MRNSNNDDRESRREEICLGVLFQHGMEWFPADIKDVSVGGISFIANEKFEPKTQVIVFFGDGSDIGNNEVHALVVRAQALTSYSPPKYLVAVKLTETNLKYEKDVLVYLNKIESK